MPERSGIVTEVTAPDAGRKMGSAKVGGRVVRFFWAEYNTENPSEVRRRLEKAAAEGFAVVATGEEMPNPRGEGAPMFKALQVERVAPGASQAPQNGSQTPAPPPAADKRFVGRDPGMADFWLATRWAWSLAAEMLMKMGKEPSVSDIAELAGEVFQASYSEALKHKEWADEVEGGA